MQGQSTPPPGRSLPPIRVEKRFRRFLAEHFDAHAASLREDREPARDVVRAEGLVAMLEVGLVVEDHAWLGSLLVEHAHLVDQMNSHEKAVFEHEAFEHVLCQVDDRRGTR